MFEGVDKCVSHECRHRCVALASLCMGMENRQTCILQQTNKMFCLVTTHHVPQYQPNLGPNGWEQRTLSSFYWRVISGTLLHISKLDIVLWPYTVHCTYIVYHPIRTEIVSHSSRSKEPAFPPLFATSLSSHRRCWPHSQRVDSHECFTFALPHFKIISSSTRLYSCSCFNQIQILH